jgi:transcriptional regulator with XRE-family HTH domain
MSSPFPNYLKTNRQRLALTQEEVAFLLGVTGANKGERVCRDEAFSREPGLRDVLAYEVLYQRPVRELFPGVYEEIEREVTARAKILLLRKERGTEEEAAHRRDVLARLAGKGNNS